MNKKIIITLLTITILAGNLFGSDSVGDAKLNLEVNVREIFLHGFVEGVFNVQPSSEKDYLLEFAEEQYWLDLDENADFSLSRDASVSLGEGPDNYSNVATYHIATNTRTNFSVDFAISDFTATGGFTIPWTLVVSSATLTNLALSGTTPLNLASGTTSHLGVLTRSQVGTSIGYLLFNVSFGEDNASLATAGSYTATVTATITVDN